MGTYDGMKAMRPSNWKHTWSIDSHSGQLSKKSNPKIANPDTTRPNHIGGKSIKSRPKIAVAIPTYNRAGYVQLCAAALTDQDNPVK